MGYDPIKEIVKSKKFNIFIWDDADRITVSWKNRSMAFISKEDVKDIYELTLALLTKWRAKMSDGQKYDVTVTVEVKGKETYKNTSEYKGTTKETVLLIENEMIEMAKRLNDA